MNNWPLFIKVPSHVLLFLIFCFYRFGAHSELGLCYMHNILNTCFYTKHIFCFVFQASVIKDKLGIGSNPAHIRSKSFGGGHEKHRERWVCFYTCDSFR